MILDLLTSQLHQYKIIVALFGDDNDPLSYLEHIRVNPAATEAEVTVYTSPAQKPPTLNECLEFRLSADKLMGQRLMATAQLKVNWERNNSRTLEISKVFVFTGHSSRVMLEIQWGISQAGGWFSFPLSLVIINCVLNYDHSSNTFFLKYGSQLMEHFALDLKNWSISIKVNFN